MTRHRTYTDADFERVRELAKTHTLTEASSATGISRQWLAEWTARRGITFRPRVRTAHSRYTNGEQERVMAMVVDRPDLTYVQIGAMCGGIPQTTIQSWVARSDFRRHQYGATAGGCEGCKHDLKQQCTQHWCACDNGTEYLPKDVGFSWPRPNNYWWETDLQPSPLVLAVRSLEQDLTGSDG